MGIVNVTPDSFSDGGRYADAEAASAHALRLLEEGADIVDVGGESTRPGSDPVAPSEERDRVLPVIQRLRADAPDAVISVDTRRAEVAAEALEAGAHIVNDVSAAADPAMLGLLHETGAGLVLMHMKGEPKTMQDEPFYDDVVKEVRYFLHDRVEHATAAGIPREAIAVDPGIGFGKDLGHNLALLRSLRELHDLAAAVVVGASRKRFIGTLTGEEDPTARLEGSLAAASWSALHGADVVRVHDVAATVRALRVTDAIANAEAV
jgi:dihydropteroate synthase